MVKAKEEMATKPREEIRTQIHKTYQRNVQEGQRNPQSRRINNPGEWTTLFKGKKVSVILRRRRERIKSKLKEISKRLQQIPTFPPSNFKERKGKNIVISGIIRVGLYI